MHTTNLSAESGYLSSKRLSETGLVKEGEQDMDSVTGNFLRDQLLDRRQRLESVIPGSGEHALLSQLLNQVDSALERMEQGSYGICEVCHESVEKERLLANPLARYCLDHLTADGRRALEQDLALASQMQTALLPKQDLRSDGWEISHHYAPHGAVSGDYCDVILQENEFGNCFFAVGDAAGKGIAASLLMTHLHAIFRTLLPAHPPLESLMEQAGRIFRESTMATYFATLVCGRAKPSGEIEIVNAGHCPPVLVHGGQATRLEGSSLPLGLFWEGEYSAQNLRLGKGDCLLLYTDGVSECRSRNDEEYGEDRLVKALCKGNYASSGEFIEECLRDLADFRGDAPPLDDLTLMAIRRTN
jgi:phosphoserine phosphatase RsbU/P